MSNRGDRCRPTLPQIAYHTPKEVPGAYTNSGQGRVLMQRLALKAITTPRASGRSSPSNGGGKDWSTFCAKPDPPLARANEG